MNLNSVKELETLLKMLRKQGVKSFSIGDMKFELSDSIAPQAAKRLGARLRQIKDPGESFPPHSVDETIQIPQMDIPTEEELSQEDLLFYSSTQEA